jgi:hypothetical protein
MARSGRTARIAAFSFATLVLLTACESLDAPRGLTAEQVAPDRIRLTYQPVSRARTYEVAVRVGEDREWRQVIEIPFEYASIPIWGPPEDGTTLHYRVRARRGSQHSSWSETSLFFGVRPVDSLEAADAADLVCGPPPIQLRWTHHSHAATGVRIDRRTMAADGTEGDWQLVHEGADAGGWSDPDRSALTSCGGYRYRVALTAGDLAGPPVEALYGPTAADPPTDLRAEVTEAGVHLSWTPGTATHFAIERDGRPIAYVTGTTYDDPEPARESAYVLKYRVGRDTSASACREAWAEVAAVRLPASFPTSVRTSAFVWKQYPTSWWDTLTRGPNGALVMHHLDVNGQPTELRTLVPGADAVPETFDLPPATSSAVVVDGRGAVHVFSCVQHYDGALRSATFRYDWIDGCQVHGEELSLPSSWCGVLSATASAGGRLLSIWVVENAFLFLEGSPGAWTTEVRPVDAHLRRSVAPDGTIALSSLTAPGAAARLTLRLPDGSWIGEEPFPMAVDDLDTVLAAQGGGVVLLHRNLLGPPTLVFRTPGLGWSAPEDGPSVTGDYPRLAALDTTSGRLLLAYEATVWVREPDGSWHSIAMPPLGPVEADFDAGGRWWLLSTSLSESVLMLLEEQ